jgi:hypothetical protein
MIFSSSFKLMRHHKQTDELGLSTIYNIFKDKQKNIWLAGLPDISVFQPPHLHSEYPSDTGTLDFENIFNLNGQMFFSETGFCQLNSPNGVTLDPIFSQTPDFNLVVLDIVALDDELFFGTESGVYLFDWTQGNNKEIVSNPRLISTKNWVTEVTFSVGLQSLAYFSKAFQNHYSVSPSEIGQRSL